MEANKYIKNKIDELTIKCIYSGYGCQFSSKVCEIERHHDTCQFRSNIKENEEILAEETKKIFENTFKPCPISQIDCELGCKQEFKHLEVLKKIKIINFYEFFFFLKKEKKECVDWLNGIIANFEKSQIGLREENLDLKKDLENQKALQEKTISTLNFELQAKLSKQQNILKETQEIQEQYEKMIKQLEEESAYKMKIFHENSEKRVEFYMEKTKEDYGLFSKNFAENVQDYFENVKQNVEVFNVQIENKTDNILGKQKDKKEEVFKQEIKQTNLPYKKVLAAALT